jgi:hypothetical protein
MMNMALEDLLRNLEGVVEVWRRGGDRRQMSRRRLEEGDMEDRMDRGTLRKLQLVGNVVDLLDDFIWPEELEAELVMRVRR